jgi:hypothetical protein
MATKTITKFDMIQVGDRIAFPKSIMLIKGGIVSEIKGVNGNAKRIKTSNGGDFTISRWSPNDYYVTRTRKEV